MLSRDTEESREGGRPSIGCLCAPLLLACGCAVPTLADVQARIFTPRCANGACHAGDTPARALDLSDGNAYRDTVNVDAISMPGARRVVPGRPDESLLYQVTVAPVGDVRQMPVGFLLDDDERDLLRAWIEGGAKGDGS